MFCCGVLPCLGFAQIRADIILISVQERLTLTKGEELISLVLRVVLGAGMQTLLCWVWKAGMRGEPARRVS